MRVVEEIPHHTFKITIFSWNARYIIKVELDKYEQTYKVNENEVTGLNDVKQILNDAFLESCMKRFLTMRSDFNQSFQTIKYEV